MNYTREPIIETVITPKEGCKLVVRNSKVAGQEEYFVDALEIVNFGNATFFRSTESPKSFLVSTTDYEVIELKETKKGGGQDDETQVSSSILRKLFPPPPNLIKEKLNHIKSPEKIDESISKEIVKEEGTSKEPQEKIVEEKISTNEIEKEKPKDEKPTPEEKKEE